MSFRNNPYGMTKRYCGFGRSVLRGGTRDRPLITPLETARKRGLVKPFDVIVEMLITEFWCATLGSVTEVHNSAILT